MNPWKPLPPDAPWVLQEDDRVVMPEVDAGRVRVDVLPEPWSGHPDAPVVLLMKAPGFDERDLVDHARPEVREAIRRSHLPEPGYFHPFSSDMAQTECQRWWRDMLGPLLQEVDEHDVATGLFVAQAFPYHVVGSWPATVSVPSADYTVRLVEQAIARGALVVLMNGKAAWRKHLGSELVDQLPVTRSTQNNRVSPGNLDCFDEITRRIRHHAAAGLASTDDEPSRDRADAVATQLTFTEGAIKTMQLDKAERSTAARAACIAHWGTACVVCGLDFGRTYGHIGEGFIHVHHLTPLADSTGEHDVNPVTDMRPVCPNCHAMLHTSQPPLTPEDLRRLLG